MNRVKCSFTQVMFNTENEGCKIIISEYDNTNCTLNIAVSAVGVY